LLRHGAVDGAVPGDGEVGGAGQGGQYRFAVLPLDADDLAVCADVVQAAVGADGQGADDGAGLPVRDDGVVFEIGCHPDDAPVVRGEVEVALVVGGADVIALVGPEPLPGLVGQEDL